MNRLDIFSIEITSAIVASLFEPGADGEPFLFDESELLYLDPLQFEVYIREIRSELWPAAFRRAHGIIESYRETCEACEDEIAGFAVAEIFKMSVTSLFKLAWEYCPDVAAELEATTLDLPVNNSQNAGKKMKSDKHKTEWTFDELLTDRAPKNIKDQIKTYYENKSKNINIHTAALINALLQKEYIYLPRGKKAPLYRAMRVEFGNIGTDSGINNQIDDYRIEKDIEICKGKIS